MTTPNNDLDRLKTPNNILARIERLERLADASFNRDTKANNLSEVSCDLGEIRMGRFLATESDGDPTDAEFSGVFMSSEPEYFNGAEYHFGGVKLGALKFGANSDTGEADFYGGNAHIGAEGLVGNDLLSSMIKQDATNAGNTRTGKLSMALADGGAVPQWEMSLESPAGDAVTITNGDFATGDFTGWTETTETEGTWTAAYFYGLFERINIMGSPVNCIGVLTSDRITDITAGLNYLFGFRVQCYKRIENPPTHLAWATVKIELKWYDHASAGNLLRTDVVYTGQPVSWTTQSLAVIAPTGALSYIIVATLPSTALANNYMGAFDIDDFSMSEITVNQKLWLEDAGVGLKNSLGESGLLDWGTYTPTLTNTTNVDASTAYLCQYFRVGNIVTVSGEMNIDTDTTGDSSIGMTLPIASAFTSVIQGGGTGCTATKDIGRFVSNSSNGNMQMTWTAVTTANAYWSFIFSYQIL